MIDSRNELVEVVDPDGTVTAVVTRAEMRAGNLCHRATFIAVIDSDGRLLVHQRSPLKDVWPSRWDLAAGGCCAVGEDWAEGARRELAEELGIEAEVIEVGGGRYEDDDVKVVGRVFLARHDGAVRFSDGEVVDSRWVNAAGLQELLDTADMVPDSIELVLPLIRHHVR